MSSGPKNAMLVGKSNNPSVTFSTTRLSSFTVGPAGDKGALMYAPYDRLTIELFEYSIKNIQNKDKPNNLNFILFLNVHSLYIVML